MNEKINKEINSINKRLKSIENLLLDIMSLMNLKKDNDLEITEEEFNECVKLQDIMLKTFINENNILNKANMKFKKFPLSISK